MRLIWLLAALVFALALAALHIYALQTYLYWHYVWLDVPVHYLGGLALAMLAIALLRNFRPRSFLLLMAGVVVGWELFELLIQTSREANFIFDTALDLLMGSLGALSAYVLARFTLWRSA